MSIAGTRLERVCSDPVRDCRGGLEYSDLSPFARMRQQSSDRPPVLSIVRGEHRGLATAGGGEEKRRKEHFSLK